MSTTHKKRKLVPAANPTANDFRLRPNHRCYPPSYPNLPGTANAGTPSAYLPVRLVPAHDGDNNNLRTATPVTAGTELLFLNGILLQTGDDYDPHAQPGQTIDIIKIHCDIDHLDVVTLLAPAATGTNPGQADQPSPHLTQPLPLNQIRYTLRGETTPCQHTNKARVPAEGNKLFLATSEKLRTFAPEMKYTQHENAITPPPSKYLGFSNL